MADRSCQILVEARAIVLTSNDGTLLKKAAGYLRSVHVPANVSWRKGRCTLRVGGIEALTRWKEEIGFLDVKKSALLDEALRVAN